MTRAKRRKIAQAAFLMAAAAMLTPAIAGGGWGSGPKTWVAPPLPPAPPLQPLSRIFAPNWYVPTQTTPPNGIDYLMPGLKFNRAGWIDAHWGVFDPPEKYDHPFAGDFIIVTMAMAHIKEICPPFTPGVPPMACAYHDPWPATWCRIMMARDEDFKAVGWDPKAVLRHERAHCNGWPGDHPGMRRAPPPQM